MAVVSIADQYATPPPGDNARYGGILDAMVRVELGALAFLGLTQSFGRHLPERITLRPPSPTILHYPSRQGSKMRSLSFGGTTGGHPGGTRIHNHWIEIAVIVDSRNLDLDRLVDKTVDEPNWLEAMDEAYCANPSLDGKVSWARLEAANWGPIPYGKDPQSGGTLEWFGWIFTAQVEARYSRRSG